MLTRVLIEPRPRDDLGLVLLLDLALQELFTRYPASRSHPVDPATTFLVAVAGGDAVGCVGLMPVVDGVGEIKRLYVRPDHRGQGIARRLITSAEALARHRGAITLRLATGSRQPEAMTLYQSAGYRPTQPYGKYARQPTALCYLKSLA
ncbi:acetyltransferase (GNAT) family protein [Kribbella amoyensis]|uniref:Acetyltransferase (GNAT) family protein n=1 Tax=Kribbella amoyensis TaxID=996641 RepID=A0A561BXE9_9ACTN|nr:GNAT family N-acetyltransferase [Kribbella amoyensis]TWD83559.1 acetyltransferase (GNAT) family protein [Kribbella amoyensis]